MTARTDTSETAGNPSQPPKRSKKRKTPEPPSGLPHSVDVLVGRGALCELLGGIHASTLMKWEAAGVFEGHLPRRIKRGPATRYLLSDCERFRDWLVEQSEMDAG